ncbi:MAG: 6-phosphogluconolactonase [Chloroflexota bacterium]
MTGEPALRIFADPDATSRAAAQAIALALREAIEERGRADWATTGGSTPVGIYRALASPPLADLVPWAGVHVWWGDDRYVPRDDVLSNVRAFDEELRPHVPLGDENVHEIGMDVAIASGAGPEGAAAAYEEALRAAGLPVADDGSPVLDIVLAGIGGDGHVLSAFPGSSLFDTAAWVSAVPAPSHIEPHVARVSLHPRILQAAALPMVVAHGAGKAAILARVLGPEHDVRRWPVQVARFAGAVWYLDTAAAASLPG